MTQKDESPTASEGPYWSEELLAVLVVGLGDETQARETLEGIIRQALSGRALQGISEEALAAEVGGRARRTRTSHRRLASSAWQPSSRAERHRSGVASKAGRARAAPSAGAPAKLDLARGGWYTSDLSFWS